MTKKEIAIELLNKFWHVQANNGQVPLYVARNCALVAVDEILNEYWLHDTKRRDWWIQVKEELEKL